MPDDELEQLANPLLVEVRQKIQRLSGDFPLSCFVRGNP